MRRPKTRSPRSLGRYAVLVAAIVLPAGCAGDRPDGSGTREDRVLGPATLLVTPDERAGETIFRSEHCDRCHTLFDRPGPDGRIDLPGGPDVDLLASRVGPDLGLEGHRRSDEWQYAHLYAPSDLVPGSRMPASRHFFRPEGGRPAPAPEAVSIVAYLQALGRARRDVWAEWRRHEPPIPDPPVVDDDLVRRGGTLYRTHCASCHGAAGDGRGELAEFFGFAPRDFVRGRYRFRSAPAGRPPDDADLFRTITLGTGTGAAMPAFYWLPADDRWALVLVVKEFSPDLRGTGLRARTPRRNAPREEDEDRGPIEAGRRAWENLGCAACHGPGGRGLTQEEAHAAWKEEDGADVPRSGDLTHACALRGGASATAIERALVYGVGDSMPSYADALADAPTLRALVSFVLSLATSPRTPDPPSPSRSPAR
jgi:mono/diheme cytochrome c family protein